MWLLVAGSISKKLTRGGGKSVAARSSRGTTSTRLGQAQLIAKHALVGDGAGSAAHVDAPGVEVSGVVAGQVHARVIEAGGHQGVLVRR